jgi:FtsP/CotA-like multicopper oxidase with cupredoxin domain
MARFISLTLSGEIQDKTIHVNMDQVRILHAQTTGTTSVIFDENQSFIVEDDVGLILKTLAES